MSAFDETFKSDAKDMRRFIKDTIKYHADNNLAHELEDILVLAYAYGFRDCLIQERDRTSGGR
jgi:hypothetical protein